MYVLYTISEPISTTKIILSHLVTIGRSLLILRPRGKKNKILICTTIITKYCPHISKMIAHSKLKFNPA